MPAALRLKPCVALLYSVVLGPERRIVSRELVAMAQQAGFGQVRTVLATGNLVFQADSTPEEAEIRLEQAAAAMFGRLIPVFVRSAAEMRAVLDANPFPGETSADPSRVAVRFLREPATGDLRKRLSMRLAEGERLWTEGRTIWIATPGPLSSSHVFRAAGSPWAGEGVFRTVSAARRIAESAGV